MRLRRLAAVSTPLLALAAGVPLNLLPGLAAVALAQESESELAPGQQAGTGPRLGAPAAFGPEEREHLRVEAGTVLRRRPDPRSAVLSTVDVPTELDVLGREGDWVEVRHGAWRGWVDLDADVSGAGLGSLLERPFEGPEPERLARAKELLGSVALESEAAGYRLISDVQSKPLLDGVRSALAQIDAAYRDWFGLEPGPPAGEAVIVYAEEEAYRTFRTGERSLGDLDPAGIAGGGLAVVHAEGRVDEELTAIVVHELVHLLNRRALPHEPPMWLEEGLASALGWARLDAEGRPLPETLWELSTVREEPSVVVGRRSRWTESRLLGPRVDLARLLRGHRTGALPSLGELVDMPPSRFLTGPDVDEHYVMSAALVRFLLEGDEGRWRAGFLRLLSESPRAELDGSRQLSSALGTPLAELETRLWRWVGRVVAAGGSGAPLSRVGVK